MNPLHAPFDPVTLATPFFVLAVVLEITLARFGKAKANYEAARYGSPRSASAWARRWRAC